MGLFKPDFYRFFAIGFGAGALLVLATIGIKGAAVWSFGGTYYQPSGGRYDVVYID